MKVCYFGTYESDNPRNILLIDSLKSAGIEVRTCHMSYWKFKNSEINFLLLFFIDCFNTLKLVYKILKIGKYDLMILGSPGERDIFLSKLIKIIKRKKVIIDTYPSINSKKVNKADMLITDTIQKAGYYSKRFSIDPKKFIVAPLTAEEIFQHSGNKGNAKGNDRYDKFRVIAYGNIDLEDNRRLILKLKENIPDITISLVTEIKKKVSEIQNPKSLSAKVFKLIRMFKSKELASQKEKNKAMFIEGIDQLELDIEGIQNEISNSDAVVVFNEKNSNHSIPREAFQIIANKKPLLIEESEATKKMFEETESALFFNKQAEKSLITKIKLLKNNRNISESLSNNAYALFSNKYDPKVIGKYLKSVFEKMNQ